MNSMSDDSEPYSSFEPYRPPRRNRNRNEKIKRGAVIAGVATVATGAGVAASNDGEILKKTLIRDPITREYMDEHGWDSSLALQGMVDRRGTPNPTVALRLKEELRKESEAVTMADIVISGYEFDNSGKYRKTNILESPQAYRDQEKNASDNAYSNFGADYTYIVYGETSAVIREAQTDAVKDIIARLHETNGGRGMVNQDLVALYFRIMAAEVAQRERGIAQDEYTYSAGFFDSRMKSTLAEGEKFSQDTLLSWIDEAERLTVELFSGTLQKENISRKTQSYSYLVEILGDRSQKDMSLDWDNLSKLVQFECDEYGCDPSVIEPDYLRAVIHQTDIDFSRFAQGGSVPWYVLSDYLWKVFSEYRGGRDPNQIDTEVFHQMFELARYIRPNSQLEQKDWYEAMHWSAQGNESEFLQVVRLVADTYRPVHFDPSALMFEVDRLDLRNLDPRQLPAEKHGAERVKAYIHLVQNAVQTYDVDEKDHALFYRFVRNYLPSNDDDVAFAQEMAQFDIDPLVKVFKEHIDTIRQNKPGLGNFERAYANPEAAWSIIKAGVPRYIVNDCQTVQDSDVDTFRVAIDEIRNNLSEEKKGETSALFSFLYDIYMTPIGGILQQNNANSFLNWMRENPSIVSMSASLFDSNPKLYTDLVDGDKYISQVTYSIAAASVVGEYSQPTIRTDDLEYAVSMMNMVFERIPDDAVWSKDMVGYFLYRAALYHRVKVDAERELTRIPSAEYNGFGYMIPVSEQSLVQSLGSTDILDGVIRLDNGNVVVNQNSSVGTVTFLGTGPLTAQEHRDLFPTMDSSDVARYGNYDAIVIRADGVSVIDPVGEYDTIDDYADHFGESAGGDPFIVGLPPEDANAFFIVTNGELLIYVPDTPPEFTNMDALSDYIQSALGANEVGVIPVSISVRGSSTPTSVPLPS